MSFNIFANPFTVLGLTPDANARSVSARARELGDRTAGAASRTLLSPRSRLSAELSHLPGASQSQADRCYLALRSGMDPDLRDLVPTARANVLAHLASSGKATATQISELVGLQDAIPDDARAAVANARVANGLPPVSQELLAEALDTLASLHAEAVGEASAGLVDGPDFLAGLLPSTTTLLTPKVMFLRRATAAWERTTGPKAVRLMEVAVTLEAELRHRPDPETASKLSGHIEAFAKLGRPPRAACRVFGLSHEPSDEAVRRWRSLAVDQNNDSDAIIEATTILEAVAANFGTMGHLGERVAQDLTVCRERIRAGDHRPQARRLKKAIAAANETPKAFMEANMYGGRTTAETPPVVLELCNAFMEASNVSPSESPWLALRALTLRLHNEFSATEAAWSLTCLSIARARANPVAQAVLPILLADQRTLRAHVLRRELDVAVAKKQRGITRRILGELMNVTDDMADRATYEGAIAKMRSETNTRVVGWGIAAAIIVTLVIAGQVDNKPTYTPAMAPSTWSPTPHAAADAGRGAGSGSPATSPEARPITLTLGELRWCEYRFARGKAAMAYLEVRRTDPATDVARFNASVDAVNGYNHATHASCYNKSYLKSDKTIIDDEISRQTAALTSEGQDIVATAYRDAETTQSDWQPPDPGTARATAVGPDSPAADPASQRTSSLNSTPPTPMTSRAYLDGQRDRRSEEAWMSSLSGGASEGAHWWAGVRSTRHPPSCADVPGHGDQVAATAGCDQAKAMLASADKRRHAEPDYRAGWNNP